MEMIAKLISDDVDTSYLVIETYDELCFADVQLLITENSSHPFSFYYGDTFYPESAIADLLLEQCLGVTGNVIEECDFLLLKYDRDWRCVGLAEVERYRYREDAQETMNDEHASSFQRGIFENLRNIAREFFK